MQLIEEMEPLVRLFPTLKEERNAYIKMSQAIIVSSKGLEGKERMAAISEYSRVERYGHLSQYPEIAHNVNPEMMSQRKSWLDRFRGRRGAY